MKKNKLLNLVKFIASIFVIIIHLRTKTTFGSLLNCLARFAVPLFFMISGYYAYKSNTIKKHIIKIFKLSLFTIFIYFIYSVIYEYKFGSLTDFLNSLILYDNIKNFFLYNSVTFVSHCWFLLALLYSYIIYYISDKLKINYIFYYISPILILYGILNYYFMFLGYLDFELFKIRNFIFVGFPFFMIGNLIHRYNLNIKFSNKVSVIIIIICSCLSMISSLKMPYLECYTSSAILSIFIFIYCLNNPTKGNNKLVFLGEECSLYIYIFHLFIVKIFKDILFNNLNSVVFDIIIDISIIFISILISILYVKFKKKIKRRFNLDFS